MVENVFSLHIPLEITKSRKRNGIIQYHVIFDDTKDGKGQWIKESDPKYNNLIQNFEQNEVERKTTARKQGVTAARRIQKIAGAIEVDNEKIFVVKFTDSERFENVAYADMKNRYTKSLLAYYEQHIVIIDE